MRYHLFVFFPVSLVLLVHCSKMQRGDLFAVFLAPTRKSRSEVTALCRLRDVNFRISCILSISKILLYIFKYSRISRVHIVI